MIYKTYSLSIRELLLVGSIAIVVTSMIAFLFYRSLWGMVLLPIIFLLLKKADERRRLRKRKEKLHMEFMEGLKALNNALQAGYSMEHAWREAESELKILYGEESYVYQELVEINALAKNNVPIEQLILEFALRTGIDDIVQFGEVLGYGKRSGANWGKIIEATIYRIGEKYETKKEVEVLLAGKRMEILILCVIPLFLLFFLQITADSYMEILYHNIVGVFCMTIAFVGYVGAIYLAIKTIEIQV